MGLAPLAGCLDRLPIMGLEDRNLWCGSALADPVRFCGQLGLKLDSGSLLIAGMLGDHGINLRHGLGLERSGFLLGRAAKNDRLYSLREKGAVPFMQRRGHLVAPFLVLKVNLSTDISLLLSWFFRRDGRYLLNYHSIFPSSARSLPLLGCLRARVAASG